MNVRVTEAEAGRQTLQHIREKLPNVGLHISMIMLRHDHDSGPGAAGSVHGMIPPRHGAWDSKSQ